ncbi:MAG: MBL fold metallo-hydrolase [Bacilli bacterium]
MKTTKFKNITTYSIFAPLFPINVFVIETQAGAVLIDTGIPMLMKSVIKKLKAEGIELVAVLFTHYHADHVGGLDTLKGAYPNIPVYMSERDATIFRGDYGLRAGEPDAPITAKIPQFATDVTHEIVDGEVYFGLTAIHTPGHSPGSMSFYDPETRVMICGDLFVNVGELRVSGHPIWYFPFPSKATWHLPTNEQSAEKIATYSVDVLCMGHGEMIENPSEQMRKAVESFHGWRKRNK